MNIIKKLTNHKNWEKYTEILDQFYIESDKEIKIPLKDIDREIVLELMDYNILCIDQKNALSVSDDDKLYISGELSFWEYRMYRVYESLKDKYPMTLYEYDTRTDIKMDSMDNDIEEKLDGTLSETVKNISEWYDFANAFEKEFKIIGLSDYPRHKSPIQNNNLRPPVSETDDYNSKYFMFKVDKFDKEVKEKFKRFLHASFPYDIKDMDDIISNISTGIYILYSATPDDRPDEYYLDNFSDTIKSKERDIKKLKKIQLLFED